MTAAAWAALEDDTVEQHAAALARVTWDRPADPSAWQGLVARFGARDAGRIWWRAANLLDEYAPRTCSTSPSPRPVLTVVGVDHDPVPGEAAVVCGGALVDVPAPSDLTPPQGTPCDDCFGTTS